MNHQNLRHKKKKNKWADHYAKRAKKDNYPARSVYKLQEIQGKTGIIKKGDKVLDLGCAPGSWLLYAAKLTGSKGRVRGIDLKPVNIKLPEHVKVYTGDISNPDEDLLCAIGDGYNVVISDMAPSTTGNKNTDSARSFNLCQAALFLSDKILVKGGAFVCKIFQGPDFEEFYNLVKKEFKKYKIYKPKSSRKASKEIYIIGQDKK